MKSPIKNQLNTVFVPVSDLKQSVKWYCQLLGQEYDEHNIKLPIYNMEINDYTGLLLDAGPIGNKIVIPSPHPLFNFHTDDIRSAYEFVNHNDFKVESEIINYDDLAFFHLKDPDGNIIMVCNG
ncbi:VOC family protein [Halobacillus sp. BBL2006]|uniref:VOC family protein n=1 Tax=Halobacillus sp. BBL2006 TaxID=1543706 RepID=UPI000543BBBF|nr:VOC family protein [Halobacillus sp. BBL2006]KHE68064.1 hypothetical protein LD39_15345 [Halobacillus sp. BBL2006]